MKLSIVIPVYNVESYLNDCIKSILNQSFKDFEMILVDDGSTDSSGIICDRFKDKDKRIRVVHKVNEGVSKARNTGLDIAQGEYVEFVDSDDLILNIMSENILKISGEIQDELVIFGYRRAQIGNHDFVLVKPCDVVQRISKEDFIRTYLCQYFGEIINMPFNKRYKLDVIKKYQIRFDEQIYMGEDLVFNLDYLEHCEYITLLPDCLYTYNIRSGSACNKFDPDYLHTQLVLIKKIKDFYKRNGMEYIKNEGLNNKFVLMINTSLYYLFHPDNTYCRKDRLTIIHKIVNDASIKDYYSFSDIRDIQNRLIKFLVLFKEIHLIYAFFNSKEYMRIHLESLFKIVKKLCG